MFCLFKRKNKSKSSKLNKLGYPTYSAYLESDHWKDKKKSFYNSRYASKKKGIPVCLNCNNPKDLNLHHISYDNLGKEKLKDLILLCKNCHKLTHDLLNMKFDKSYSLINGHKLAKKVLGSNRLKIKFFDLEYRS